MKSNPFPNIFGIRRLFKFKAYFFTISFFLISFTCFSQNQTEEYYKTKLKANTTIGYLSYLPPAYHGKSDKFPLMIFLHGQGQRGSDLNQLFYYGPPKMIKQGKWDLDLPFIVISPQTPTSFGGSWDPDLIDEVIDQAVARYRVDESRIYVTGTSMGGNGTWKYATKYPNRVAAIVPICGWGSPSQACEMKDVPTWAFHNEDDRTVNVSGTNNMVDALNKCPAKPAPKKTIYPASGHDAWTKTYDLTAGHDIYSWMLSYTNKRNNVNQPPVANAGGDKTLTLPDNSMVIAGSGTDNDGSIISYQWTKISGPSVTMNDDNKASLRLTNLVEGTYTFKLTVTDNKNATASDEVKVTVHAEPKPVNQAPIANAGGDAVLTLPENNTVLKGSGEDSDGEITAYRWTKVSGPAATMVDDDKSSLTLKDLEEGNYTFRLTVTDNEGETASDEVKVTVNPEPKPVNQAPIANAGGDEVLTLPENSTVLKGSGEDRDGEITAHLWTMVSGPAATMADTDKSDLTLKGLVEGHYTFRLTVTDNEGATASDEVKVTVNPEPKPVNQAPIANAGGDEVLTLPENSTVLKGSGEDRDGEITAYIWTKVSGPTATMADTDKSDLTLKGLVEGHYIFRLTVTDNEGATASDEVKVTVDPQPQPENQTPIANAGVDRILMLPENSAVLNGSGEDMDGEIASYLWTKVSGPVATMVDTDQSDLQLNDLVPGIYTFRLTVADNEGATGSDEVKITINQDQQAPANLSPIANAGGDKTLTLPENTITLNGSGEDEDGDIVSYLWTKVSGPGATVTNTDKSDLILKDLVEGTYAFKLTVTDNEGATASDEVQVTVNPAPKPENQVPIANAGDDKTLTLPKDAITLTGSGEDKDGEISAYLWVKVSGPEATMTDTEKPALKLSGLQEGTYIFKLSVTDNEGATASDETKVTVKLAPNQIPTVNAGNDKTLTLPSNSTTVEGSATDSDGAIVSYRWTKASGPQATMVDIDKATLSISNLVEGSYTFTLTVTDNRGATASDEVKVTVKPAPNQPPTANAGKDVMVTLPNNAIKLSGSGTDSDGQITGYQWSKLSGPAASIADVYTATLSLTNLVAGVYTFKLTVTDNRGAKASDEVKVTVNIPPLANAGRDKTLTLPENSTYISGAGSDRDGTIAAYSWTKKSGPAVVMKNAETYLLLLRELKEGTYVFTLEVTDNRGAKASDDVKLTVLPAPNLPPTVDAGRDKKIQLPSNSLQLVGNASDPDGHIVAYIWEKVSGPNATMSGSNDPTLKLSGLTEGTYNFRLTVRDNKGATASAEVRVIVERVITEMTLEFTTTHNGCFGANEGEAFMTVTGGEMPYTYFWSNGENTESIASLGAGNYTLTVTDRVGRSVKGSVNISQPDELRVDVEIANETNRGHDGKISAKVSGGTAPYTYEWSNGSTKADNEKLERGEYTLLVRDAKGCIVEQTYQIDKNREYNTVIYPNPSNGRFNLIFDNLEASRYELRVYDGQGTLVFEKNDDISSVLQMETLDISDKKKGIYFIKIAYDGVHEETRRLIVM